MHAAERQRNFYAIIPCMFLIAIGLLCAGQCLSIGMSHSGEQTHKMISENGKEAWKVMQDMEALFTQHHVTVSGWVMVWKGRLAPDEWSDGGIERLEELAQRVSLQFQTTTDAQDDDAYPTGLWVKEDHDSHQLQWFGYPQNEAKSANLIYTWSGSSVEDGWKEQYTQLEEWLNQLCQDWDLYMTLYGTVSNATADMKHDETFTRWIVQNNRGNVQHVLNDSSFTSVTGYIPDWDQAIEQAKTKINIQAAARYNNIEKKTYLAVGHPLILQAH